MSAIRRKGMAAKMVQDMQAGRSTRFARKWFLYPKTDSVQPGDDAPVLASVDPSDPPGRLPTTEDVVLIPAPAGD
jgi:hypothetical protein